MNNCNHLQIQEQNEHDSSIELTTLMCVDQRSSTALLLCQRQPALLDMAHS